MSPRLKVIIGVVLLIPALVVGVDAWSFRFDNPALTETQLFNEIGWMPYAMMVLAVPGAFLVWAGIAESEEPDL